MKSALQQLGYQEDRIMATHVPAETNKASMGSLFRHWSATRADLHEGLH
jgi:hypothetical protein